MKNIVSILAISLSLNSLAAQDVVVKGPDEKLQLVVFVQDEETPCYSVTYNGKISFGNQHEYRRLYESPEVVGTFRRGDRYCLSSDTY